MSSVKYYRDLLAQPGRIEAFRRAIDQVVKPGDRVLDVGTGLGTFAFFAADAGAARVWAVEGDPIVHVARAIAQLNGYDDTVEFIRGWMPSIELSERADVVIFEDFPPRLIDAAVYRLFEVLRARYAAPGASFVPEAARLYAAPVGGAGPWREAVTFEADEVQYGLDWTPSRDYAANAPLAASLGPDHLAAPPALLDSLRFEDALSPDDLGGEGRWAFDRTATIHGLAYWFELDLGGGETLSNAPGEEPASWGQLFLAADPPVAVPAGSTLVGKVRSDRAGDGTPAWLAWELMCCGAVRRGHEFAAVPASLADVAAASPDGVPRLSPRGRLDSRVLGLVDGVRSVREIARAVAREVGWVTEREAEVLVVRALQGKIELGDHVRARKAVSHD